MGDVPGKGAGEQSEGTVESPAELPGRGWRQTLKRTAKGIKADRIPMTAAALGFDWLRFLPVDHRRRGLAGGDVPESRRMLKKRLCGLVLMLAALALGGVAAVLLVFGESLREAIAERAPLRGAFVPIWVVVRWTVAVAALTTLFALFYYLEPNRQPPSWTWVSPGGLVALVVWLAASLGYSLYVTNFGGSYERMYGSLAGVIVLVLWLFLTAFAVLAGGELNAELERQKAVMEKDDPDHGMSLVSPRGRSAQRPPGREDRRSA